MRAIEEYLGRGEDTARRRALDAITQIARTTTADPLCVKIE